MSRLYATIKDNKLLYLHKKNDGYELKSELNEKQFNLTEVEVDPNDPNYPLTDFYYLKSGIQDIDSELNNIKFFVVCGNHQKPVTNLNFNPSSEIRIQKPLSVVLDKKIMLQVFINNKNLYLCGDMGNRTVYLSECILYNTSMEWIIKTNAVGYNMILSNDYSKKIFYYHLYGNETDILISEYLAMYDLVHVRLYDNNKIKIVYQVFIFDKDKTSFKSNFLYHKFENDNFVVKCEYSNENFENFVDQNDIYNKINTNVLSNCFHSACAFTYNIVY